MKTAIIFAGQGSQFVGMGLDYYQDNQEFKTIFDAFPIVRDLCFENEKINNTENAQPAIFLYNYAVSKLLDLKPDYTLGLSLGEYNALQLANAFTLETGMDIVTYRGKIMAEALNEDTSMYAIIKNNEVITSTIAQFENVFITNYNSNNQTIIAGKTVPLQQAVKLLKEQGCRCIPLKVSGAFHTPFLNDTSLKLKEMIKSQKLNILTIPVVSNYYGNDNYLDLTSNLEKQICSAVKFKQSLHFLKENKVEKIIEIGPKSVIKKLVEDTVDIEVISICSLTEFKKYKESEDE